VPDKGRAKHAEVTFASCSGSGFVIRRAGVILRYRSVTTFAKIKPNVTRSFVKDTCRRLGHYSIGDISAGTSENGDRAP
jgi:hypothetical protein